MVSPRCSRTPTKTHGNFWTSDSPGRREKKALLPGISTFQGCAYSKPPRCHWPDMWGHDQKAPAWRTEQSELQGHPWLLSTLEPAWALWDSVSKCKEKTHFSCISSVQFSSVEHVHGVVSRSPEHTDTLPLQTTLRAVAIDCSSPCIKHLLHLPPCINQVWGACLKSQSIGDGGRRAKCSRLSSLATLWVQDQPRLGLKRTLFQVCNNPIILAPEGQKQGGAPGSLRLDFLYGNFHPYLPGDTLS